MKRWTSTWTAMMVAGFLAVPGIGFAQTPAPAASAITTAPDQSSASPQEHLQKAESTLSSIAPASMSGKAATQIAQLKKHLTAIERMAAGSGAAPASTSAKNAAGWATEAAAADKILGELLASDPATGAAGASTPSEPRPTGTSGVAPSKARSAVSLDEETRGKLTSVRTHLTAFAVAMSGAAGSSTGSTSSATGTSARGAPANAATTAATAPATAAPASATGSPSPSDPARPAAAAPTTSSPAPATQQAPATPPATPPAAPQPATPAAPADPSAPETQPPAAGTTASTTTQTPQPGVDAETAKRALTSARDTLSQMTQLPAAAQLAGENRTQVAQLISNFNELITTSAEWKAAYAKVDANITALIGAPTVDESSPGAAPQPAPSTPATPAAPEAVGTSGTTATSLDPALKAKLVEFRTNLKAFEKAAGGVQK